MLLHAGSNTSSENRKHFSLSITLIEALQCVHHMHTAGQRKNTERYILASWQAMYQKSLPLVLHHMAAANDETRQLLGLCETIGAKKAHIKGFICCGMIPHGDLQHAHATAIMITKVKYMYIENNFGNN